MKIKSKENNISEIKKNDKIKEININDNEKLRRRFTKQK